MTPSSGAGDVKAATILDRDLRAFIETLPQLAWRTTADGRNDYFNQVWYDYTGLSPEESLGSKWSTPVHPDDLAPARAAWEASVRDQTPYETEFRIRGSNGEYRWFLTRATPLRDPNGAIVNWYGTCTDIDAHMRIEARDAFLARADELFAVELEPQAILRAVARAAVASFADYVLFDLVGDDGTLRRTAVEHRDPQRRGPFQRSVGEVPPLDHPVHPIAAAWRSGESVLVPRIDPTWWKRAAKDDAHYQRMSGEGLTSLLTVVIASRGRSYGVLTFCRSGSSQSYGDADLATAEDLARRIGAALENARLYQEARASADAQRRIAEREGFYARLGEAMAETLDLRETLEAVTKLLVPLFGDWAVVNLIDENDALYLAASHHRDAEIDARTQQLLELRYLASERGRAHPRSCARASRCCTRRCRKAGSAR